MRGAIPLLPNTHLWRGAQLKAEGQLYLYIYNNKTNVFTVGLTGMIICDYQHDELFGTEITFNPNFDHII
jgi:hypothetical protein